MDKYDGFPEHLRVPFLEKEKRELKLFMDAVLDYVKEGTGCSQTNGQFYQVDRIEQLSFASQKKLAYRIKSIIADETEGSFPKFVLSFFVDRKTGCVDRASEILRHCHPKAIAISEKRFST